MNEPYALVHSVHEEYKHAEKLARITGKSAEIYRSHGREPKSSNPIANGNVSPVTHYMSYCELYEAAEPGSGRMLNARVHEELETRFTERDLKTTQRDLHIGVEDETCDVRKWLASHDIPNATRMELLDFERECDEAIEAINQAKSKARVRIREIEKDRRAA